MSITRDSVEQMIMSAINGEAVGVQDNFNAAMAPRIAGTVDAAREYIAKTMFGEPDDDDLDDEVDEFEEDDTEEEEYVDGEDA